MSAERRPTIALTTGEPAGVGPELAVAIAGEQRDYDLVLLGDRSLLESTAGARLPGTTIEHVPLRAPSTPGRGDPANGAYVLELIDRAVEGCLSGRFAAMVTAPVHKGLINESGIPFTGHTEYLAERTNAELPVMMLVGGGLRVALATTHLPLARVSAAITTARLSATLQILDADLRGFFGIAEPRILVCGLNPHAGENGYLGREEIDVIEPALEALRAAGLKLTGPVPADTAFLPAHVAAHDAVLAMYHDQGLPVIKHASFGLGVNVTLGLPILRTSVDHGTAFDLAGTGRADAGSLRAAADLAASLSASRCR